MLREGRGNKEFPLLLDAIGFGLKILSLVILGAFILLVVDADAAAVDDVGVVEMIEPDNKISVPSQLLCTLSVFIKDDLVLLREDSTG